jgi:hypothetical protein
MVDARALVKLFVRSDFDEVTDSDALSIASWAVVTLTIVDLMPAFGLQPDDSIRRNLFSGCSICQ